MPYMKQRSNKPSKKALNQKKMTKVKDIAKMRGFMAANQGKMM